MISLNEYDIGEAFEAIEERLIKSMMRNMARHRVEEIAEEKEWSMWQAEQLKALEKYKKANQKAFQKEFSRINKSISDVITQARQQGNMEQEIEILEAIKNGFKPIRALTAHTRTSAEFFRLNDRKIDALIKATKQDLQKAEVAMLRMANDQYRKLIFNAQVFANTGSSTYEQAVDMASKDFFTAGINCIEYKNGTRHTIADYASMALQTASKRAYFTGEGEKRQEWGITTVIMNKRGAACPKCLPFVGKILIDDVWSGGKASDGPYSLMSRAIAKGLYHPRCKDSHTTYFEGITTPPKHMTQADVDKAADRYLEEEQQKYNERMVQKYKALKNGSLDPDNIQKYDAKLKEWENKLKGLDISDDNVIIKTRDGAGRAADYEKNWASASLSEIISKFLPSPKASGVTDKGKIIYKSKDTKIQIVYDTKGKYFRIEDTNKNSERRYLDLDGNDVTNKTENGRTMGRSKSEYQSITHFKNKDGGKNG